MANNAQAAAPPRRRRLLSLTMWLVIAVLVTGALAGLSLSTWRARTELVVVAARDLPAFHFVSTGDVSLRNIARSAVPPGAVRSLAAVRGHYLWQSVDGGSVLAQAAVGPTMTSPGRIVVPLPLSSDNTIQFRAGDLVDVLLAPDGPRGQAVVIRQAEVVEEVMTTAGRQVVYLAVPCSRERDIAQVAGRGTAILAVESDHKP